PSGSVAYASDGAGRASADGPAPPVVPSPHPVTTTSIAVINANVRVMPNRMPRHAPSGPPHLTLGLNRTGSRHRGVREHRSSIVTLPPSCSTGFNVLGVAAGKGPVDA